MTHPTLYHKGSKGVIYSWTVSVEGDQLITEYGTVDGEKTTSAKTCEAKNVGKSNETTPEEQALKEATALWKKKREKKYFETIEEAEGGFLLLPMLASSFESRKGQKKDGHTYPCYVQPKLDGIRCIATRDADGEVKLYTRQGKIIDTVPHVNFFLEDCLLSPWVLDGELYVHGWTFQDVTKAVKKNREESAQVALHVYDLVMDPDNPADQKQRQKDLEEHFYNGTAVRTVRTELCQCEDDIFYFAEKFMKAGYEGAMVRMFDNSAYKFGYRSKRLLKVKEFKDAEFEIIDFDRGVNDACIWICKNENGQEFRCLANGTADEKKEFYVNGADYIGELLKVKYFELTDDGIPRFPVALGIRMKEDT